MEKQEFKITIDAPREKVWQVLWNDETFRLWTSPFSEGSHAVSDWKKGSKILFLDGKGQGMASTIANLIPNEYMSFKHLGMIKDGVEDYNGEEVKKWAGALEEYFLESKNDQTLVTVQLDISEEYKDMFNQMFPKALQKLKEIAESKVGELI